MAAFEPEPGRRLSFHRRGQGRVVICHTGGPGFAGGQLGNLGDLDCEAHLVLVDPRGTGASDPPADGTYAIADYVHDLEALVGHLAIQRATVFGHSHGGFVVARYAAEHPENVNAVILDSTPIRPAAVSFPPEGIAGYFHRFDDAAKAYVQDQLSHPCEAASSAFFDNELATLDLTTDLQRINAPTLVIVGDHDFATGQAGAEAMVSLLVHGRAAVIAGAGHFPWIDEPADYRAAIAAFLRET